MAYDFNRNFGQGAYGQGGRLSFQGGGAVPPMRPLVPYPPAILAQGLQRGGRVGRALSRSGVNTKGLRNMLAMEDAMEALQAARDKATGYWDTAGKWIQGAGDFAKIASTWIPGVGPLLSTGIEGLTEGLGTVIADAWAPDINTPQDIISRQGGMGRRNWEKIQEAYGDLSEFSRSAGRKMRAGIASSLPANYLKAKTADELRKLYQGAGGGGGGGYGGGSLKPFESPAGRLEVPVRPKMPIQFDEAQMIGDLPVPEMPYAPTSIWDKFYGNFMPGDNLSFGKLGE